MDHEIAADLKESKARASWNVCSEGDSIPVLIRLNTKGFDMLGSLELAHSPHLSMTLTEDDCKYLPR